MVPIFRSGRSANGGSLRFRCSRTKSTLRSGSRKPLFSTRPDLNLSTPFTRLSSNRFRFFGCGALI
ncbi:hypothetical protein EB232_03420 [Mesorhizobium sp. NZP2077]|nr:hypothetical protein EB232_03420 [Mesorhizobium sp. NZP2077]